MVLEDLFKDVILNEDFESLEEFKEELAKDKEKVVDYLKWRAVGGKGNKEVTPKKYDETCKKILEMII